MKRFFKILFIVTLFSACTPEEEETSFLGCVSFQLLNPEITGVSEVRVLFATSIDGSSSDQFTLNRANPSKEYCQLVPGEYVYLIVDGTSVVGEGTVRVTAGSTQLVGLP